MSHVLVVAKGCTPILCCACWINQCMYAVVQKSLVRAVELRTMMSIEDLGDNVTIV